MNVDAVGNDEDAVLWKTAKAEQVAPNVLADGHGEVAPKADAPQKRAVAKARVRRDGDGRPPAKRGYAEQKRGIARVRVQNVVPSARQRSAHRQNALDGAHGRAAKRDADLPNALPQEPFGLASARGKHLHLVARVL